jgi:hypothetical protein
MTPRERFLLRIRRHLRGVEPEMVRTYLRGLARVLARFSDRELLRILSEGGAEALVARLTDEVVAAVFAEHRVNIRHEAERGVMYFGRTIPGVAEAEVGAVFGVLNPRVMRAIADLDNVVTRRLGEQVRESVRGVVAGALERGDGPRQIVKDLRPLIGLGPSEVQQIRNFRDALTGANGRRWEDYTARDPRFDVTIRRAMEGDGPSAAQVDRMVDSYARRRHALAAETNARTAMLDTYRHAQQSAWDAARAAGIVESDGLMKEWLTVRDSRVRDEHAAMDGEVVPFDQPYSTGQMVPGEGEWNCRCWSRVFVGRA